MVKKSKKREKQIERICKLIKDGWCLVPEQRLGQFLANYVFGHHVDIFFQRDEQTEDILNGK